VTGGFDAWHVQLCCVLQPAPAVAYTIVRKWKDARLAERRGGGGGEASA
jgi:hypothetical protein